jgi:lipoyl(octanoyl) transferase
LHWTFLGELPYGSALSLQEEVRAAIRRREGPERLLLLTHPHVYTLGRNARETDVTAPRPWLAARGIDVVETDRGGQVTYHGPGQLVGYPVVDLSPDRRDVRRYVHDLQQVLVRTLADFDVDAQPRHDAEHIGVWVGEAKIASIGVHIQRWITTHGFALNVAPDLSFFAGIVPCGLPGVRMTSLERLTGVRRTVAEVAARAAVHFAAVFERPLVADAGFAPAAVAPAPSLADAAPAPHGRP